MYVVTKSHKFLSRLCGGELVAAPLRLSFNFLSRLCGGELFSLTSCF